MFGVNPHHYWLSAHDGNFGGYSLKPLVDRVVQHFGRDEQGSLRLQIARSCDRVAAGTWI
ncbi:hypothetical protein [Pseudomonas syringae group genomosp. 3]|uniref:hypothetical protein n=1 Tax=Pseudomonas syringae group genomosp. 3 TaxID=251701 RepID=UPI0011B0CA8C|nr:hypothetical protein [Pseudomonas syringae group genomosp. 3]